MQPTGVDFSYFRNFWRFAKTLWISIIYIIPQKNKKCNPAGNTINYFFVYLNSILKTIDLPGIARQLGSWFRNDFFLAWDSKRNAQEEANMLQVGSTTTLAAISSFFENGWVSLLKSVFPVFLLNCGEAIDGMR